MATDEIIEQRRRWFEQYCARIDKGVIETPLPGHKYNCPCCGYPTLDERGGYEICSLCNWEDDGQDDPHVDEVWGGPNGRYSLTEARENFKKYGVMYSPGNDMRIVEGDTEIEREAKEAIKHAFDSMSEATDAEKPALWSVIGLNGNVLRKELKRKVAEYERELARKKQAEQ